MEVVLFSIRILLVGVFAVAAVGKFMDLDGSRKAVAGFGVPRPLAAILGVLLPVVELAIAISLISTATSWYGSAAAFLLLLVFIVGMLWQMANGKAPDCHCFGALHSEPVSKWSVSRNAAFAASAAVLAAGGPDAQGLAFSNMTADLAILFAISAGAVTVLLAVVFRLQRTVKVLEGAAGILAEVERDGISHPDDALPIGALLPYFTARSLDGRFVSNESLILGDRPFLMFFVGPACDPCAALLPEIEAWKAEFGERLEMILVSSGDAEENRVKFGGLGEGRLLLQERREISEMFRAKWTPSAVFVCDGLIASRVAVGDSQIRDLVDGLRTRDVSDGFVFVARGTPARVRIGERVEDFRTVDIEDREITNSFFEGGKTLVLFLSNTCSHCVAMLPDVKEWEANPSVVSHKLLVVAEGDAEMYRMLGLDAPVIIEQAPRPVALKLGMHGAPSAVVVDENGVIVTETAIGAPAIWSLVGKF
jgi:thiol-disulfide isomerase/thioredoxin/uncharacterized membrane protein YphA (DoxX/SURF4 family)